MKSSYTLYKLLLIAKGDRGLNQFSRDCGLSQGNVSRLLNKKIKQHPSPETLRKIAENCDGRVSVTDLLTAAGYMESDKYTEKQINNKLEEADKRISLEKRAQKLKYELRVHPEKYMINEGEELSPEAIASIITSLEITLELIKHKK